MAKRSLPWILAAGMALVGPARPVPSAGDPEAVEIEITAERFRFTPDTVTVPQGARVRLIIRSADVLHGFAIPDFDIDRVIRRRGLPPEVIEFTAERAGRFEILCSEYCGDGHDDMTGRLMVVAGNAQ